MEQLDTVYKSLYKLYSTTQKYFVKYSQLNYKTGQIIKINNF